MRNLEFRELLDYIEGVLPLEHAERVENHISQCNECKGIRPKIERFLSYAGEAPMAQAPQAVTARLLNVFRPARTEEVEAQDAPNFFEPLLVFDDWQMALSERRAGDSSRSLLYRSGEVEIDLRLEFVSGKCNVIGQIFGECADGFAEMVCGEQSYMTMIDENCEFAFQPVPFGIYKFRYQCGDVAIEIPDIKATHLS
ncbi:MAG: zf-HC2 domain-containing protein [Pyrinomonadaceae bacterium]